MIFACIHVIIFGTLLSVIVAVIVVVISYLQQLSIVFVHFILNFKVTQGQHGQTQNFYYGITYTTWFYAGPVPLHRQECGRSGGHRVYLDGENRRQAGRPAADCRRSGRTAAQGGDAHHPDGRRAARHAGGGGTENRE